MKENELPIDARKAAESLAEAASLVFAEMAFLDAVPLSESLVAEPIGEAATQVCIAIDVLKPLSLRLELRMPQVLARRIEENLYGGEASDSGREDSSLELLNVLAGNFLSRLFGAGKAFKLELPFYLYGDSDISGELLAEVELDVEGLHASMALRSVRYRY